MQDNAAKINGHLVALDDYIEVEANSPFFGREEHIMQDGSRITPQGQFATSTAKFTREQMQLVMGHIDKLTAKNQPRVFSGVELQSKGIRVDQGKLFIDQVDRELNSHYSKFGLQFISGDIDDFFETVKNKTLKDLVLNGIVDIPGGNINDWGAISVPIIGSPDDVPDVWENGDNFVSLVSSGTYPVPTPIVFQDIFIGQALVPSDHTDYAATAWWASQTVNDATNPWLTFPSLAVYTGDKAQDGTPALRMCNRWDDAEGRFITYKTEVIEANGAADKPYTRYTQTDNSIVPMYFYSKVLDAVFSEFGYELQDNWLLQDADFLKLVIVNCFNIVRPSIVHVNNIYDVDVNDDVCYYEQTTEINPANHLPGLSVTEFLRDFMLKFNCYFNIAGKKVTIVHNELETTQREVKDIGPAVQIIPERKQGLKLGYNLDENEAYKAEAKFTTPFSTLPNSDAFADLVDGDYYISEIHNEIRRIEPIPVVYERICSNLIPYNSGDAKIYDMPMVPVNCGHILIDKIDPPAPGYTPTINTQFMPYIYGAIGGVSTTTYNYEFQDDGGGVIDNGLGTHWSYYHEYAFAGKVAGVLNDSTETKILGFYHGLMETGDVPDEFPYMSFHNYQVKGVSVKLGNWHLGIIGQEGLIVTYWRSFVNIFNNNRRAVINAKENFLDIRNHKWNQAIVCNGAKLYLSKMRYKHPIHNYPIYECFEL